MADDGDVLYLYDDKEMHSQRFRSAPIKHCPTAFAHNVLVPVTLEPLLHLSYVRREDGIMEHYLQIPVYS